VFTNKVWNKESIEKANRLVQKKIDKNPAPFESVCLFYAMNASASGGYMDLFGTVDNLSHAYGVPFKEMQCYFNYYLMAKHAQNYLKFANNPDAKVIPFIHKKTTKEPNK
jgi:hypothetical protein